MTVGPTPPPYPGAQHGPQSQPGYFPPSVPGGPQPIAPAQNPYRPFAGQGFKPNRFGQVVAVAALFWGVICIFAAISIGLMENKSPQFVGLSLFGLSCIVPAAWFFYCNGQDRKKWDAYNSAVRTREQAQPYLTESDAMILQGMGALEPPQRTNRRWLIVALVSCVLFLTGVLIGAPDEEEPVPAPVTEGS